jgi:hypothetical protein
MGRLEKIISSEKVPRTSRRDGRWLALIPLGVGLVFAALMLPRSGAPDGVPLPVVDASALAAQYAHDHALAEDARREPLPGEVRALGSAMRDFHLLEAQGAPLPNVQRVRQAVDTALVGARTAGGLEGIERLRAAQLETFLAELRHFEATGEETAELEALAGAFVRRMRLEGWCDGHTLAMSEPVRRTLFKQMFDAFLGLEGQKALAPSLDEMRVLYAFYLSRAHPRDSKREAFAAARRAATEKKQCDAIAEGERIDAEAWRLERIEKIAAIDPAYPAAYARGVASFHRHNYSAAADAFRAWLKDQPDGPWTLRAESYLRAAVEAERTVP